MDREELKRRIRAGAFIESNGRVLRTINILRKEFNKLSSVAYALDDIPLDEFLDSVNYLHEAGYIKLRLTESHALAPNGLADNDYRDLEGKLTVHGIRLLAGDIEDSLVRI